MPNSCNKCFVCHSESFLLIFNITFFIILKKKKKMIWHYFKYIFSKVLVILNFYVIEADKVNI